MLSRFLPSFHSSSLSSFLMRLFFPLLSFYLMFPLLCFHSTSFTPSLPPSLMSFLLLLLSLHFIITSRFVFQSISFTFINWFTFLLQFLSLTFHSSLIPTFQLTFPPHLSVTSNSFFLYPFTLAHTLQLLHFSCHLKDKTHTGVSSILSA